MVWLPLAFWIAQQPTLELASLFTDHMVLQREIAPPIWGWDRPGTEVTVEYDGKTVRATADAEGKWMAKLARKSAGGPYEIVVRGSREVRLKDVLVGDVWICSGQSNMEMGMGAIDRPAEVAAANHPNIRFFMVPHNIQMAPVTRVPGEWSVCTPESILQGGWAGFSAVGYFFGLQLHQDLNVPIGLIGSYWGGTIAEAWASGESLKRMPDFKGTVEQVEERARGAQKPTEYQALVDAWYVKNDPGTRDGWQNGTVGGWAPMNLPVHWEDATLPNFDGVVWFERKFGLDAKPSQDGTLTLGPIDDADATYVNGTLVGATSSYNAPRKYRVPASVLREGENVIYVRVLDTGGGGGLYGTPDQLQFEADGKTINLAGPWNYKVGVNLSRASAFPMNIQDNPNVVTVLSNGMIEPLVPFGIKGAIWYQGESNAGRGYQYRELLPLMINDWRKRFQNDFPFFIVQLANFQAPATVPGDDAWAELREAQYLTALRDRKVGIATAIDIGDAADIHPKDKKTVGQRLALSARKIAYGQRDVVAGGPRYRSMRREGDAIRLSFDDARGLVANGAMVQGFAIAGTDHKWVWADARIEGETVLVRAAGVPEPVAVRYAWAINPVCNLYNGAGLPAFPFRTDDWGVPKK